MKNKIKTCMCCRWLVSIFRLENEKFNFCTDFSPPVLLSTSIDHTEGARAEGKRFDKIETK